MTGPEVIFADEPTGALDPYTADGVMRLLRQAAAGTTVVIVTHQPEVTRFCDRAVFLYAGRVDAVTDAPEPGRSPRGCTRSASRASDRCAGERMRGWMLAGLRRCPGPLIGTLAAAVTAAALASRRSASPGAHTPSPLGRLAGADVVVAAAPSSG